MGGRLGAAEAGPLRNVKVPSSSAAWVWGTGCADSLLCCAELAAAARGLALLEVTVTVIILLCSGSLWSLAARRVCGLQSGGCGPEVIIVVVILLGLSPGLGWQRGPCWPPACPILCCCSD